jgi:glucose-1-phosphate thymidylyltransferase
MQAVILAAGEGKRVRPLTRNRPKGLIPVANRPIIDYVIEALLKSGIRDIIVVAGYRKEQVTRYLNQLEVPVTVAVQEKQLGTAHALTCAEPHIRENFLVLPCDNYIDPASIARILSEKNAMLVKEHPSPSNFGVVQVKGKYIQSIVEKPESAESFIVSTGILSLTREFFSYIESNLITDAIASMLASGEKIRAVHAHDWQDAIFPWDLLTMNARLLRTIPAQKSGTLSRNVTIEGNVCIGEGTTIGPNSVIKGPVILGENCTIGPNCCVMPDTSLGDRVTVEPFSYLGNAMVMDDVSFGSHSRITDAVIGEDCALSDHTVTFPSAGHLEIEGHIVRAEFGAVLGDRVRAAPFTVFRNCIVGNGCCIMDGHRLISRTLNDDTLVI